MGESPIEQLLGAVDRLDGEAVMALLAAVGRLLAADGRRAQGPEVRHVLITQFLASCGGTTHRITCRWHVDDTWIAEVDAAYELRDGTRWDSLPRAIVLRSGPGGIADLRVYGAHERRLATLITSGRDCWWEGGGSRRSERAQRRVHALLLAARRQPLGGRGRG